MCNQCTFHNFHNIANCEICGIPRPKSVVGAENFPIQTDPIKNFKGFETYAHSGLTENVLVGPSLTNSQTSCSSSSSRTPLLSSEVSVNSCDIGCQTTWTCPVKANKRIPPARTEVQVKLEPPADPAVSLPFSNDADYNNSMQKVYAHQKEIDRSIIDYPEHARRIQPPVSDRNMNFSVKEFSAGSTDCMLPVSSTDKIPKSSGKLSSSVSPKKKKESLGKKNRKVKEAEALLGDKSQDCNSSARSTAMSKKQHTKQQFVKQTKNSKDSKKKVTKSPTSALLKNSKLNVELSPSMQMEGESEKIWECLDCTFHNQIESTCCEMCSNERYKDGIRKRERETDKYGKSNDMKRLKVDKIIQEAKSGAITTPHASSVDSLTALPKYFFACGYDELIRGDVNLVNELLRYGWICHRVNLPASFDEAPYQDRLPVQTLYVTPTLASVSLADFTTAGDKYSEGRDYFKNESDVKKYISGTLDSVNIIRHEGDTPYMFDVIDAASSDLDEIMTIVKDGIGDDTNNNYFANKFEELLKRNSEKEQFAGAVCRDVESGCIIGIVFGSIKFRRETTKVSSADIDGLWVAMGYRRKHLGTSLVLWYERCVKIKAYIHRVYVGTVTIFTEVRQRHKSTDDGITKFWLHMDYVLGVGKNRCASKEIDILELSDKNYF